MFLCEFSEIFKNMFFTEHLRDNASVFYWRKKNILFTLSRKEQSSYEAVKFLLETLIYKIWFWNFLAQRKSGVKLVKDIFKHFIIDVGFTSCLTSIRLTYQDLISESFLRLLIGRCPRIKKHQKVKNLISVKIIKKCYVNRGDRDGLSCESPKVSFCTALGALLIWMIYLYFHINLFLKARFFPCIQHGRRKLFYGRVVGGGGELSNNVVHHGWPRTKKFKKKRWL